MATSEPYPPGRKKKPDPNAMSDRPREKGVASLVGRSRVKGQRFASAIRHPTISDQDVDADYPGKSTSGTRRP